MSNEDQESSTEDLLLSAFQLQFHIRDNLNSHKAQLHTEGNQLYNTRMDRRIRQHIQHMKATEENLRFQSKSSALLNFCLSISFIQLSN